MVHVKIRLYLTYYALKHDNTVGHVTQSAIHVVTVPDGSAQPYIQYTCAYVGAEMAEAISLQWNCSFARVAIKELSQCKRGQVRNIDPEFEQAFKSHFDIPTYNLPENLFQANANGRTPFQSRCTQMLNAFSKPWNKATERAKYFEMFSLQRWKTLSHNEQGKHMLSSVNSQRPGFVPGFITPV